VLLVSQLSVENYSPSTGDRRLKEQSEDVFMSACFARKTKVWRSARVIFDGIAGELRMLYRVRLDFFCIVSLETSWQWGRTRETPSCWRRMISGAWVAGNTSHGGKDC
jgi:hypothetical protein